MPTVHLAPPPPPPPLPSPTTTIFRLCHYIPSGLKLIFHACNKIDKSLQLPFNTFPVSYLNGLVFMFPCFTLAGARDNEAIT